ncbi:uncharacterized protein LOC124651130 [Lolium rigidum]|uniref:uncharacterized protein LOC124651130 n=1 Tax=Lolium rigidum TaxID=89674 RepID=UPI001F5C722A|nr:uncharacterized protein LOC124651130 [Lolium rigidum]
MYATRPLSLLVSNPKAVLWPPPDGGNSGYLVVKDIDDDSDDEQVWCTGGVRSRSMVENLPFPQNRVFTVGHDDGDGENKAKDTVLFVPVLDQPLASNRYYPVIASGRRKGLVRACSREEDMTPGCLGMSVNDVEPRPFDPADIYQQIEIVQRRRGQFTAKAVAPGGIPYKLYGSKYWRAYASRPKNLDLGEARGINAAVRSRQLTTPRPRAVVGRWYCPFYLVKEGGLSPAEQLDRAAFYEVTLEQRWEPIRDDAVSSRVLIGGSIEARQEVSSSSYGNGYVWFISPATWQRVGVSTAMWERMRWEEYMGGWVDEETGWVPGRSVLVERFAVKRRDGSVAMAFEFAHINKITA